MPASDFRSAPLKGASRRMVAELCRRLIFYGPSQEMIYVGLGATEFIDFEVIYQAVSPRHMFSIEKTIPIPRLEFNRPYEQIKIEAGTTVERLPKIDELLESRSVTWLDYYSTFDQSVVVDMAYLGAVARPGSAIFVTLNAHYSAIEPPSDEVLRERFGDYFDDSLQYRDYAGQGYGDVQLAALETVLNKSIDRRSDGATLDRVLDLRYKDSARMQVAGWFVGQPGQSPAASCRLQELPFTAPAREGRRLELAIPDLTPREWDALVRQLPMNEPLSLRKPHEAITDQSLHQFAEAYPYLRTSPLGLLDS